MPPTRTEPRSARRRLVAAGIGAAWVAGMIVARSKDPQARSEAVDGAIGAPALASPDGQEAGVEPFTLTTFGDSILDCRWYNDAGIDPGSLLLRNDDGRFPEFRGRDLLSVGPAQLDHRAVDGATVEDLPRQAQGLTSGGPGAAILTVGGNDLLRGLLLDDGPGIDAFAVALEAFLRDLPIRPVFVGTVYDPTFGDDARNFTWADPARARANHRRVNAALAGAAQRHGGLADLHAHFLTGDPSWYANTIEPSLRGASEVRRVFLPLVLAAAGRLVVE